MTDTPAPLVLVGLNPKPSETQSHAHTLAELRAFLDMVERDGLSVEGCLMARPPIHRSPVQ